MSDSVDDLLDERIDGEIEAVTWYNEDDGTYYGLVMSVGGDGRRVSMTTVILDLDDETLRVHGRNSMWLPADGDTLDAAIRSLARTTNAVSGSVDDEEPMRESLVGFDAEDIGRYTLDDDYQPDDGGEDWKASSGPEEMTTVFERLVESPVSNAERMIRLEFGEKAPWSGEPKRFMRHPDEIGGNYGVEVSEEDDLVILDIDDMAEAPLDDMPETLACESPHDGEHRFYHVPGWQEHFQDRFGLDNPHPSYGEVRSQDGYVVGPGSELTTCKHEDCCSEASPGEYVLVDAPIATVDAETFGDLLAPFREVKA